MNRSNPDRFGAPRVVVRETDDYVARRRKDTDGSEESPNAEEPRSAWVRYLVQPALVTLLIGCIAWPIAHVVPLIAPEINRTLLWLGPVAMAFIGFNTQRRLRERLLSGTEATRLRLIELGVLFLLIKLFSHLGDTPAELVADLSQWAASPLSFFDTETVVTFLVGCAAWLAAGATARDLEAVSDPTMYLGETGPRERLISRYFTGGAILMFFAALNRVNVVAVITLSQVRVRRPIVSALIYFFAGLLMLGMMHFTRLVHLWRRDGVSIADKLDIAWLRYLLLFLALVSAVAFVLPTGYTISFLDLISAIIAILGFLLLWLYAILMWPLTWLLGQLMGASEGPRKPPIPRMSFELDPPRTTGGSGPVWEIVRSVVFWAVLIGLSIYLVRSYLRDRPELWRKVRRIQPQRWLGQLWTGLRSALYLWLTKLKRTAQRVLPALSDRLSARLSLRRQERRERAAQRRGGATPREQLIAHYLQTLDQAATTGHPRSRTATPYEYAHALGPALAEDEAALAALTAAFVEARYSVHPVSDAEVGVQAANAARVARALTAQRGQASPESDPA
jgi:hypothetical protein